MPDKDKKAKQLIMNLANQGVFDACEDAISIQDTDFKVLYQNVRHKNMIGEHIGEDCYRAYQRKDSVCENCHLAISFTDGKVHKMEQVRTTDDGKFYYEITALPLKDPAGKIIAGMEVVKDISKRKQAEEALATSEEKYRLLINSLQEGIWALDKEENTSFVNNRMAEMLGYTAEEMLGKKVFDFMDERGVKLCKEKMEKRKAGVKEQHDFELIKKDGSVLYVLMEASPIKDEDGNYIGGMAAVIDITDRKKAEEDLLYIAKGVGELIGEKFFIALVQHISKILKMDYAYIAEIIPDKPGYAKTISFSVNGSIIDNIVVDVSGTPCEKVTQNGHLFCPAEVQKHFPAALTMAGMNVESYFGVSLSDSSGMPIGLLSVMGRKEVEDVKRVESVLRIFGARAESELERLHVEKSLNKYKDRLEHLVKERTEELEKQKSALEDKNVALREVIGQIELEKTKIRENIASNIEELIIPILKKSRARSREIGEKQIDLIEQSLKKITSSFGVTLSNKKLKLTPREIDICNLVEKGLTNKEMSDFFNISIQSIEGYRKNIRKKLGLSNKKVNLIAYLRNFQ